ncbi:MAG: hypothetical protein KAQ65_11450 [Candidatus Thorarchaeota archaeon]|nr:hypothetical protein [Candidatus Thorarchaeota archaeon]
MNEYSILMKMLTRTGDPIGAGVDDMLDALGYPENIGRHVLFQRLGELHSRIEPIGLAIRHNPVSHVFYIDTDPRKEILLEDTPLPDRLAATLLVVITLAYQEGGWVSIDRIRQFRRKARRSVVTDLRELGEMGYIDVDTRAGKARPGTRVAFEIDYEGFFRKLAQSKPE